MASDGRPCVAQRVCPMPVVAGEPFRPATACSTLEVADGADDLELVALDQRDAGRVVAAVLEALEPADQERLADAPPV